MAPQLPSKNRTWDNVVAIISFHVVGTCLDTRHYLGYGKNMFNLHGKLFVYGYLHPLSSLLTTEHPIPPTSKLEGWLPIIICRLGPRVQRVRCIISYTQKYIAEKICNMVCCNRRAV